MKKKRYFVLVAHCLLNPATRVHVLGRSFTLAGRVCDYLLNKHVGVIQLPCAEFTALGYWRNPQGRDQYDSVFFRRHCEEQLKTYVDEIQELIENDYTLIGFIGIQGSPTCSIKWGKHKQNKYKTESIMPVEIQDESGVMTSGQDENSVMISVQGHGENCVMTSVQGQDGNSVMTHVQKQGEELLLHDYGVMTKVLAHMLAERGIQLTCLEAPVKQKLYSNEVYHFFDCLDERMDTSKRNYYSHTLKEEVKIQEEKVRVEKLSEKVEDVTEGITDDITQDIAEDIIEDKV